MTTAVTQGSLRLGEVGPEISGPPGSVLTFGPNGRTLSGKAAAASSSTTALEKFADTIVAPAGTTTTADGPVHTAADLLGAGVAAFPAGARLAVNYSSLVSGDGAGDVKSTTTLEFSLDGGATWNPVAAGDEAVDWFTATAINLPVTTQGQQLEIDLSAAPSFALRAVYVNDAAATASASFAASRLRWQYVAP
jgi:hypothetical protein